MPIVFDHESHTYSINGKQLQSVSSLIEKVTPKFDRERIAGMVAAKRNMSVDAVLAEWDRSRNIAVNRGELVHAYIEDHLGDNAASMKSSMPECQSFDKAWKFLTGDVSIRVISMERIVYDESLGMAGRLDMLASVAVPETIDVRDTITIDWKTGKYRLSNHFEKMLKPFHDLDSCEHTKASMQACLYKIMLESNGIPVDGSSIVHLGGDGNYSIFKALNLQDRLMKWLKGGC